MSSADMKNRVDEERRNPAALENQQKSLENQQKGLKLQQKSLETQQQTNELQKEANLIRRQQLEAQEAANKLASESIEVQKDLSKIQRQYYNEQIKIDSRMLEIAEERAERERNIVFCRWCGRQMPFAQIIDYLDVEVCSLQCRKMYRQHLIEENRLMYCDHCGNDLILDVVERDYDNVTIGTIVDPLDHDRLLPVTLGDAKILEETEAQSAITDYWNRFKCCDSECLVELLSKDESIMAACNRLLNHFEINNIYNTAVQKINDCCFEDALTLFDSIPQYADSPEKSRICKKWIADYTTLVNNTAVKVEELTAKINGLANEIKTDDFSQELQSASESLCEIKDDFLKAVPAEHYQYNPIKDLLASIKETEDFIATIKKEYDNGDDFSTIIKIMMFVIIVIICVGLGSCLSRL